MKIKLPLQDLLSRMTVGRQLLAAFGTLLALTAALGAAALWEMKKIDGQAQVLAEKWLLGVGHLATARTMLVDARSFETRHSRTDDASYHAEYEDKLKEIHATLAEHLAAYEAKLTGADERGIHAALMKAMAAYQAAQQQVVSLGREKKQQDAADISDGLASMAYDEALGILDKQTQLSFEGGKAAAATTAAAYLQARWLVLGALGTALTLGLLLAVAITRGLQRQLGGEPADAVAVARAVAQGDLSTPIPLRAGDNHSLMAWLQNMQAGLAAAVHTVRDGSQHVASASAQIAQGNQDLSERTEAQASALQQTSATMDTLGKTVQHNADNARQASQLAEEASRVAVQGGTVVGEVVQTMKGINDSSRKIADIIGTIDGIAFQTNILALNAAVEAARAGEQGRGFAVVAGEVRSLAQRSAEAAREIKALIGASVERVAHGSTLVDRAGQTMQEVVSSIRRVSDIVGEISAASNEQNDGVAQVGQAVAQMDRGTQQNAALVEQSAAAAESLRQHAEQLVQAVAVFKLGAGTDGRPAAALPTIKPRPARAPAAQPAPAPSPRAAPAAAKPRPAVARQAAPAPTAAPRSAAQPATTADDDWQEF